MLLRALNDFFQDDGKCDIALNYETGNLIMVDTIEPRKKYNKMFFNTVGKGIQIGEYKDGKFSPELQQFLRDNPDYNNDPLIAHLVKCMNKKKQS